MFSEVCVQRERRIAKYREESFRNNRLRDKGTGHPENGFVWYDDSPCETSDPNLGFWGPACEELPLDPVLTVYPVGSDGVSPKNDTEELEKYCVLLAAVHDWMLPSCAPIYAGNHPKLLKSLIPAIELNLLDEGQVIFEMGIGVLKADGAQSAPQAKDGQRIAGRTGGTREASPETEYGSRNLKEKQEGLLEPKLPESLQKLLWMLKYGRKHWKLILLAIAAFVIWSVFAKSDLPTNIYTLIRNMCS